MVQGSLFLLSFFQNYEMKPFDLIFSAKMLLQKVMEMYIEPVKNQPLIQIGTKTAPTQKKIKTHCIGSKNVYYRLFEALILTDNENLGSINHMFGKLRIINSRIL